MKYIVSKTYDVVTPESAAEGDVADSGFEFESKEMDLEDVMREVEELGSYENLQDAPVSQSLYAADGHTNYKTGEETRYALHIDGSEEDMQLLVDILEGRKKMPEEGSLEHQADELLKMFSKQVSIDEVVAQEEPKEVEIGGLTFTYGGRELSVSEDGLLFIWDVNSIGDRHSYMLFDIQDENGESVTESVQITEEAKAASLEDLKSAMKKAKADYKKGIRYYDEKHRTYHPADYVENILQHVSDLVGYYGVESYDPHDSNPSHPRYQYVNSGDIYGLTVVYDKKKNKFIYTDIGTIMDMGYMTGDGYFLSISESGEKFKKLTRQLAAKGARDPKALAAWIGREKLGKQAFQKKAAAGRKAKAESTHLVTESFGRHEKYNYAVKVDGVDSKFYMMPFGRQLDDLKKIKKFTETAKTAYVGAKGKATLAAVKDWVRDMKPTQYYAKWQADSSDWKNDSVEIFYVGARELKPIDSTDLAVTVEGKTYGYALEGSVVESKLEEAWLPRMLKPEHEDLVAEVSNKIGYDVEVAQAFAVALLEDVNAHEEAAKVNAALTEVEEVSEVKTNEWIVSKELGDGRIQFAARVRAANSVEAEKKALEKKPDLKGSKLHVSIVSSTELDESEEDEMKQLDKMQAELQALYKSDKPEDAEKAKALQPKVDALFKKLYTVEKLDEAAAGSEPSVYVGTYGKYAGGSIAGKWLNLEDYADHDEFMQAAEELHKDEEDPELMFQDFQGFPERYYSESSISPKVWEWLEMDEGDRELLEVYIDEVNDEDATIEDARDHFIGKFDSERDWAMEFIDESGGLSPEQAANYIYVDDVTARTIGIEEADARLEDMSDEDAVEEAGMTDEYETAMDAEDAAAAEQIVSKARDEVSSKISDEVEEAIKKDAVGYFVDELGAYTEEELASQSFVSIDYDAYARDARLGGDVSFVRKDGDVWVFANY